jgi:hypothetical protein
MAGFIGVCKKLSIWCLAVSDSLLRHRENGCGSPDKAEYQLLSTKYPKSVFSVFHQWYKVPAHPNLKTIRFVNSILEPESYACAPHFDIYAATKRHLNTKW